MVLKIHLRPEDTRSAADGDAVMPEDNKHWQKISADVMKAESLLEAGESLPDSVIQTIKTEVTDEVNGQLGWSLKVDMVCVHPFITDVIRDVEGDLKAIFEWKFDEERMSGHGGHGKRWVEARSAITVTEEQAKAFLDGYHRRVEELEARMEDRAAYHKALKLVGLDEASVNEARQACLRKAGLDHETIDAKRLAFEDQWDKRRGNHEE